MKRILTRAIVTLSLMATLPIGAAAQGYVAVPVTVSKEKVRSGGKVYYSHVVQERQTLYSISKAYGVSQEEIFEANPTLNLETEGLKKNQILMIPVKDNLPQEASPAVETPSEATVAEESIQAPEAATGQPDEDEYFLHKVKWFEDLDAIAKKYGVSKESIININGLTSGKVKRKQELKIPRHPEDWEGRSPIPSTEGEAPHPTEQEAVTDTAKTEERAGEDGNLLDNIFLREGNHDVSISLLVPFSSPRAGDRTSFMDFYCGSLLAARSLSNEGMNIDIHTYDIAGGNINVSRERFSGSDFSIGPVSRGDILKAASVSDGSTWIVSPLDQQVEALADTLSNLIQAPTPTSVQIKDMVSWIKEDMKAGDKVIVVTPSGAVSSYAATVESEMNAAGLPHSTTTLGAMASQMVSSGTNRVVLACDFTDKSTVFLIEAVRNLYMMNTRKGDLVLYSTSKIRTYDQIEVEQLHRLNLHTSVTYFVDYESRDTKDFLLQYRALFGTEPSRSAYSGYDLMKYFSILASKYGKKWPRALDRVDFKGLQSDFLLQRTESGSYVNKAVRRVVYNPDYSVTLVR